MHFVIAPISTIVQWSCCSVLTSFSNSIQVFHIQQNAQNFPSIVFIWKITDIFVSFSSFVLRIVFSIYFVILFRLFPFDLWFQFFSHLFFFFIFNISSTIHHLRWQMRCVTSPGIKTVRAMKIKKKLHVCIPFTCCKTQVCSTTIKLYTVHTYFECTAEHNRPFVYVFLLFVLCCCQRFSVQCLFFYGFFDFLVTGERKKRAKERTWMRWECMKARITSIVVLLLPMIRFFFAGSSIITLKSMSMILFQWVNLATSQVADKILIIEK